MIRRLLSAYKQHKARKRLAEITEAVRNSFECERYRRNRAAQLKRRARG